MWGAPAHLAAILLAAAELRELELLRAILQGHGLRGQDKHVQDEIGSIRQQHEELLALYKGREEVPQNAVVWTGCCCQRGEG